MIGCLDVIRPLVLTLPKMIGYLKTFKDENNKSMSFCINDDKLLEKCKAIWTKIEDLKNVALPVYDGRYIKTKIRTYADKTTLIFVV